jgi:MoaA/NifB/PqqE/SkfB family radical SAM enzyme
MAEKTMRKHMNERFGKVFNFCENPPLPSSLNVELNNTCNHKCEFCGFHGRYSNNSVKPAIIPVDTAKHILDEAKRLGIGKKEVGFYLAGEPFVYKELTEVVAYAKKLGFTYTFLTSNGALATPDRMKALLDAGIDSLRFSVNAADRETYREVHGKDDFEVVCENIKFMREYIDKNSLNVATSISSVITKKTDGMQDKIIQLFGKYVDDILFIPVKLQRLDCDEAYLSENQIIDDSDAQINENFVCPMLFDTMYITANLKVIPCCEACASSCAFYDLKENMDLEAAWNCEDYKRHRRIFLNKESDEGTVCKNCMLRMKGVERLGL